MWMSVVARFHSAIFQVRENPIPNFILLFSFLSYLLFVLRRGSSPPRLVFFCTSEELLSHNSSSTSLFLYFNTPDAIGDTRGHADTKLHFNVYPIVSDVIFCRIEPSLLTLESRKRTTKIGYPVKR